jgi:hypothetical protein
MNDTSQLYQKIFSEFSVSWNIDELEREFETIELDRYYRRPYSDPNNRTHWQHFSSGIAFCRNFHLNFNKECIEVAEELKKHQRTISQSYRSDNRLILEFLRHNIRPDRVNITKIMPTKHVGAHVDITRDICLNIGLKRSNKWDTLIQDTLTVENFEPEQAHRFVIDEGTGYLMSVKHVHSVACNDYSNQLPRYVITYNLLNR